MNAKTKLSIILGLTIIIVLATTTLFGRYAITSLVEKNSNLLLHVRANLKVQALDEKLKSIFNTLQMAAREIAVTGKNKIDEKSVIMTLNNLREQLNVVEGFMALEDGTTYVDKIGLYRGFNAKDKGRRWYLSIFQDKKKLHIGKPYFSTTTNQYVIPAGVEVVRGSEVVAVLCIDMELSDIANFITNISNNREFFLTNEDGVIFASKQPINIGKSIFKIFPEFKKYDIDGEYEFDFIWKEEKNQKYKMVVKSVDKLGWHFWQYESYNDINKDYNEYLYVSKIFFVGFIVLMLVVMLVINNVLKNNIK